LLQRIKTQDKDESSKINLHPTWQLTEQQTNLNPRLNQRQENSSPNDIEGSNLASRLGELINDNILGSVNEYDSAESFKK